MTIRSGRSSLWTSLKAWWSDFPQLNPVERRLVVLLQVVVALTPLALIQAALVWMGRSEVNAWVGTRIALNILIAVCGMIALALLKRGTFQGAVLVVSSSLVLPPIASVYFAGFPNHPANGLMLSIPLVLLALLRNHAWLLGGYVVSLSVPTADVLLRIADGDRSLTSDVWLGFASFTIIFSMLTLLLYKVHRTMEETLNDSVARAQHLEDTKEHLTRKTEELERANRAMEEEIAERRRLEGQLLQSHKMESIGRLAGGIAHDFNNLLTVIQGHADLARGAVRANHPVRVDIDEITRASDRAAEMVRRLLAFARKQQIEPKVLSLNELLEGMERMLRRLIGGHVLLINKSDPDLRLVKADPGQIEQVVVNLVVNARDAMPSGGTIVIETSNVVVDAEQAATMTGFVPGSYVLLRVEDSGIGMTEAVRLRAFEPFFTTKSQGQGSGLGLATTYGIVKQHGGYVDVRSTPGEGTVFRIYLPVTSEVADSAADSRDSSPSELGQETILLVEDEPSVRQLLTKTLADRGYRVHSAANGEEALGLFNQISRRIDLLLTDIVMPGVQGTVIARSLREKQPDLAVLLISGYAEDIVGPLPGEAHKPAFLHKPFTPQQLATRVREVLDSQNRARSVGAAVD